MSDIQENSNTVEMAPHKPLNFSNQKNYVLQQQNGLGVYIFDTIQTNTCYELVGHMVDYINRTPQFSQTYNLADNYKYDIRQPSIDIHINSHGGDVFMMKNILSYYALARSKGLIIRTFNVSQAYSAASILACTGDKGHRIMDIDALNMIHYGTRSATTVRENEMEFVVKQMKDATKTLKRYYLENTKLNDAELSEFYKTEGTGCLNSAECLAYNICDWVLLHDGTYTNDLAVVGNKLGFNVEYSKNLYEKTKSR